MFLEFVSSRVSISEISERLDGNEKKGIVPTKTIEKFLASLPHSFLRSHTYVYKRPFSKRKDVQEASFLNPRAIVFGNDGKLVLSNGEHISACSCLATR